MKFSTKDALRTVRQIAVTVLAGLALKLATRALENARILGLMAVVLLAMVAGDVAHPLDHAVAAISPNPEPAPVQQNCPDGWSWFQDRTDTPLQTCSQRPIVMIMVPYEHRGSHSRDVSAGGDAPVIDVPCTSTENWPVEWC